MPLLKSLTGSMTVLLMLAGGLRAEDTAVSRSTNPNPETDYRMAGFLVEDDAKISDSAGIGLSGQSQRQAIASPEIVFSEAWVAQQPQASGDAEFDCLVRVMYFEARGESLKGQAAVAEVVLNRVELPSYPKTICGVVGQSGRGSCQFSWVCDDHADRISDAAAFARAAKIARALLDGAPRALTDGATHFHTPAVNPGWAGKFTKTTRIGAHIFYREPTRTASG